MSGSNIQLLSEQNFGISRSRGGHRLLLNPGTFKNKSALCMFGIWNRAKPHSGTDQAYIEFRKVSDRLPGSVVCAVLDIAKYPTVVGASHKTIEPIASIPKVMLFGPDGIVIDIFASQVPKTAASFIQFTVDRLPKQRPRKSTKYVEEESSDEDSYEEAPAPRRKGKSSGGATGSGGYYEPEFGTRPKVGGFIRGGTMAQDEGEEFLIPEDITPHNTPWATESD